MYAFVVENTGLQGTFNMTAPNPVINSEFTQSLAQALDKKIWLPKVPEFGLKLILGELSALVLDSARVSSSKIQAEGFKFEFPVLDEALKDIYAE